MKHNKTKIKKHPHIQKLKKKLLKTYGEIYCCLHSDCSFLFFVPYTKQNKNCKRCGSIYTAPIGYSGFKKDFKNHL